MVGMMRSIRSTEVKYAPAFLSTFGVPLSQFWDRWDGFDVIAFDEWLGTPEDRSAEDVVRERYGESAVVMCKHLIWCD